MSLRVKLALALMALTSLATIVIGAWSYASTADQLHDEIDRSLEDATTELIRPPGREGRDLDRPGFDLDDLPGGERPVPAPYLRPTVGQMLVQVIDADGTVLLAADPTLPIGASEIRVASDPSALPVARDVSLDDEPYRLLTTPLGDDGAAIQMARSLVETDRVLDSLRNLTALAVLGVTAAAAAVGWMIAGQVTQRLTRLTRATEEVAATGRFDVEVPVGGTDEAGRLAVSFNRMLEALARSKDAQQRLVQDAGHELRTPLTSLRTNISVLQRHEDLPADTQARVLEDLDAETRELTAMVNELVDLATDQRGDEPVSAVTLGAIAERVAERARRRSGRQIEVVADGTVVRGREQALERAISNLVDNAAKFDVASGAPIEVTVRSGRVEVCDRGPGIAPDDLPHLFDRFYRAVDARSRPGSGLGLAIVRDVATSHGGTTWAANRDGGGACVGFEIPVPPRQP